MENPPHSDDSPAGSAEAEADTLRRLEQRLDRASEAAERLIVQVAQSAAGAVSGVGSGAVGGDDLAGEGGPVRPPPAGWQVPQAEGAPSDRPGRPALDAELLNNILGALRDVIPPELQERLAHALRELLLAVRALIDWYVNRLERRREEPPEVRDIPIL